MIESLRKLNGWWLFLAALVVTAAVYASGLSGSWLFDDYPNIVNNPGIQIHHADISTLTRAALSSPSSEFKRPLASLTFALNYLAGGLNPVGWKVTNVVIHLINGLLVFLLARLLLRLGLPAIRRKNITAAPKDAHYIGVVAAIIAGAWMLLPINLTAVLYVVQRMASLANVFVLLGLIGYVIGRMHMRDASRHRGWAFVLCIGSLIVPTAVGFTAKETAVMLPLYAFLIEWVLFRFRISDTPDASQSIRDKWIISLFTIVLLLPMIAGLIWLIPSTFSPGTWARRDFTLGTRLLSEARIIIDYIVWTIVPTPGALSFYHDGYVVSQNLFTPWTTLPCIILIAVLLALAIWLRKRAPLVSLGLLLFFGSQTLTGTILPLELVYEHRNYFASFGLMLAIIPLLAALPQVFAGESKDLPDNGDPVAASTASTESFKKPSSPQRKPGSSVFTPSSAKTLDSRLRRNDEQWNVFLGLSTRNRLPLALPRGVLLVGLLLLWTVETALTAYAWGNPLLLAQTLAARAPNSPRAQYELGRTYIVYSHYDPDSIYTKAAYAPLEHAAALPKSSILPQQALIFMNARMHLPIKAAWWNSMIAKLKTKDPGVQDISSLVALTECARDGGCNLSRQRMIEAFLAALSHPHPSARLLATYGDYAWNVLGDHALGVRMTTEAVKTSPKEPAYHITLTRMLAAQGRDDEAREQIQALEKLNIGGRLNGSIAGLRALLPKPSPK